MKRSDLLALLLSLLAVLAGYLVSDQVFERMAHIEDEMAYLWQAQAIAGGHLSVPSPPEPKSFLVPFVIDHNGQRFGKYPLGWPILLAIGVRLKIHYLVNPILGGLAVWLTYLLGKRTLGETVGLLAALLTLTSPFFLMNTGSLLSHPFGLVLSASFALAWLDAFSDQAQTNRWLPTLVAGLTLGVLALTRPFTALAVGLPFGLYGLYLLLRGDGSIRRRVLAVGSIALIVGSLYFAWQYAVTGDPLLNPYTLWWEYDTVGFGPGHGHTLNGHDLKQARVNTRFSLRVGGSDLFGWGRYSWIFLPFGFWAMRRNGRALLLSSVFPILVVFYLAYWIGASLFGPRYFYEGLYSLTLTSAAGIAFLAGWPVHLGDPWPNYEGWRRARALAVTALLAMLISINLVFYAPRRIGGMHGLYGVERAHTAPFLTASAQELTPALIIVHNSDSWIEYGTLLDLQDPFLNTPFIFIIDRRPEIDASVAALYPDRNIFYYYPVAAPYTLYTAPLPSQ